MAARRNNIILHQRGMLPFASSLVSSPLSRLAGCSGGEDADGPLRYKSSPTTQRVQIKCPRSSAQNIAPGLFFSQASWGRAGALRLVMEQGTVACRCLRLERTHQPLREDPRQSPAGKFRLPAEIPRLCVVLVQFTRRGRAINHGLGRPTSVKHRCWVDPWPRRCRPTGMVAVVVTWWAPASCR